MKYIKTRIKTGNYRASNNNSKNLDKTKDRKDWEKFHNSWKLFENWFAKAIHSSKNPFVFEGTVQRREGVSIPLETTAATWWKTIGPWKENWTESRGKSATLRLQFSPQGRSKIRRGGENPSPFDALSAMRIRHDHGSALDAATRFRSHVYHANY